MEPAYIHECKKCRFLGTFENGSDTVDYYICLTAEECDVEGRTVIARYSNEAGGYSSHTTKYLSQYCGYTLAAAILAQQAGLVNEIRIIGVTPTF